MSITAPEFDSYPQLAFLPGRFSFAPSGEYSTVTAHEHFIFDKLSRARPVCSGIGDGEALSRSRVMVTGKW